MRILPSVKLPDNHNIFVFGDKHDGSVLSCDKGWDKLLDIMLSRYDGVPAKHNYGMEGGDMIEAIMADDPRFSPEKLTEALPLEQVKMAVKRRKPIKNKLLDILMGNHCRKLWRFGDLAKEVADTLGVPYGTYTAKLTIHDSEDNQMYKIYHTHGFKSVSSYADDPIRRKANTELILKRHLRNKAADCAVMIKHHTHKLLVTKPHHELYLYDNNEHIKQGYTGWGQNEEYIHPDARWYGNAGSFLKLFGEGISGYAEIFELDPTELGFLILKVRDRKIIGLDPYFLDL
uniref:Putative DNA exonuclease n=1 Tax=viral metagenome TaxID=1070528 RepID=A0A6M3LM76_9ZZZZ